jgi:uncharacterized membrane protein
MIGLTQVYILAGITFAAFALLSARDSANPKRWGNAAFWALLALRALADWAVAPSAVCRRPARQRRRGTATGCFCSLW